MNQKKKKKRKYSLNHRCLDIDFYFLAYEEQRYGPRLKICRERQREVCAFSLSFMSVLSSAKPQTLRQ